MLDPLSIPSLLFSSSQDTWNLGEYAMNRRSISSSSLTKMCCKGPCFSNGDIKRIFSKGCFVFERSEADLATAAGLGPDTIYKLLNLKCQQPYPVSCLGISRTLRPVPETAFRVAKLIPTEPEFTELCDLKIVVAQLSDRERKEILLIAKVKLEFKKNGNVTIE
jgi:hypothetical protein